MTTDTVLSNKSRVDVYQSITEKIVRAIEEGAGDFVLPWHRSKVHKGIPTNVASGARYRGINVVSLWAEAMLRRFDAGYWGTYRQWQGVGAQVKRGEQGSPIVFYTEKVDPERGSPIPPDDGPPQRYVLRHFAVFNCQQVEGWEPPDTPHLLPWEACDDAELFIRATGANIEHGGERACYIPKRDMILMPPKALFLGSPTSTPMETYYSTLLHELVHWTGAKHRLDRGVGNPDTEAYAKEELIAEIGAAFLCEDLGVTNEPRPDHAAYLAGYLKVLKGDPRAIFKAARAAQVAADCLRVEIGS